MLTVRLQSFTDKQGSEVDVENEIIDEEPTDGIQAVNSDESCNGVPSRYDSGLLRSVVALPSKITGKATLLTAFGPAADARERQAKDLPLPQHKEDGEGTHSSDSKRKTNVEHGKQKVTHKDRSAHNSTQSKNNVLSFASIQKEQSAQNAETDQSPRTSKMGKMPRRSSKQR